MIVAASMSVPAVFLTMAGGEAETAGTALNWLSLAVLTTESVVPLVLARHRMDWIRRHRWPLLVAAVSIPLVVFAVGGAQVLRRILKAGKVLREGLILRGRLARWLTLICSVLAAVFVVIVLADPSSQSRQTTVDVVDIIGWPGIVVAGLLRWSHGRPGVAAAEVGRQRRRLTRARSAGQDGTVIRIGTSGWLYPPWRGVFYPEGLPHRRELEYLSGVVDSIEINGTFYSMKKPADFASWYAQTPDDFLFSVKAPRFITHMKKLNDPRTPTANFFASGLLGLGPKLGPILWQLPPSLGFRPERLVPFFELLPRTTVEAVALAHDHDERVGDRALLETEAMLASQAPLDADRPLRHALEVRHNSFITPELAPLLRKHDIALVVADTAGRFPALEDVTADFVYVRLHGADELYVSGYTDQGLDMWAEKVRDWASRGDVYVYFDNDAKVYAPRDAQSLAARLAV